MTWLGKILAVLVLLLALVWAWFNATVFVTRTNWKTQADTYKKAFEEAKLAREAEYKAYATERDALYRQINTEQDKSKGLADRLAAAETANQKVVAEVARLNNIINNEDVKAAELANNLRAALDELDKVRARSNTLEDERKDLVIAKANAERDRQAAENFARQSQAEKLIADRKIEDLVARVNELQTTGGSATTAVLNGVNKAPAPVPEGLRGTVMAVSDDHSYVVVSVGIDAGLTVGATLDVYREVGGEGKYIGTLVIDRVQPKQAGAVFKPADPRRTLKQLRPDELPKTGDTAARIRTSAPIR